MKTLVEVSEGEFLQAIKAHAHMQYAGWDFLGKREERGEGLPDRFWLWKELDERGFNMVRCNACAGTRKHQGRPKTGHGYSSLSNQKSCRECLGLGKVARCPYCLGIRVHYKNCPTVTGSLPSYRDE